ncbi:Protein Networked (NET), actin-binding (NAB) domain containing protein [Trema orientale]|uniref:Protein Networked (NET), actin-binding (NAB) domain containing protein n=1 Tax=Trema orientale TaxID=63057 RepID=A0A2P5F082_TREOI|nr:Protein Networked (NET), actin-binding (NAB) domain containing protein [Trema orientale]
MNPKEEKGDTFAERAESYYSKQPQLLALLQDLYNAYVTLSDRYTQSSHSKNHHQHHHHRRHSSSQVSTTIDDNEYYYDQQENYGATTTDHDDYSDVESSLSYEKTMLGMTNSYDSCDVEASLVSELVMKNVEVELMLDELARSERRCSESSRKIELQKSLLEVLESERLILLNENARLGYRVAHLAEENRGLVSESMFAKRKAAELARCMVMMREDQRVCMLSRKIEDLQGQIYGLEKRNKEYYEQLLVSKRGQLMEHLYNKQDDDDDHEKENSVKKMAKNKKKKNEVILEGCFQMKKFNQKLMMMKNTSSDHQSGGKGKKVSSSWWERVRSMDLFLCGVSPSSA